MRHGMGSTARCAAVLVAVGLAVGGSWETAWAQGEAAPLTHITKNGQDVDLRSFGRQVADALAESGNVIGLDEISPVPGETVVPQIQLRGGNVQGNDAGLDNIQIFPGFRPFLEFTQSETSIAAFGRSIVVGYNSSANQPLAVIGGVLQFTQRFLTGFSASNDGGQTWTSGFVPPVPGSIFTFGDPVVAVDRHGTFYFSALGANASRRTTMQVNKSSDGGGTWSDAVVVQQDNGADKDWMAVGPDPMNRDRDNVYVTWTSFQPTGQQLRFGRSTDGGATWTTKTVFAPVADPTHPANPQNSLQFTNPVVDPITGRLYIPFARFSNSDQDFIQVLASDDAGETFTFLTFNDPSAPDPTLLTVTQPGELTDCRSGGRRLTIHAGPDQGGRFGLRSFVHASRLTIQPAFAARNGMLYLAWSNSTSLVFGDPNSGSNILFVRSEDGGRSWTAPLQVNPTVPGDNHHVLPSLAIDVDPNDVHISYYTQHADGTVDLDMANSHNRGTSFPSNRTVRVSGTGAPLPPTNVRLTNTTSTNYDRTIVACYALGEYQGITTANGSVYAAWGDTRNVVTEPTNALDPLSGLTHAQTDVFFQKVKAQ